MTRVLYAIDCKNDIPNPAGLHMFGILQNLVVGVLRREYLLYVLKPGEQRMFEAEYKQVKEKLKFTASVLSDNANVRIHEGKNSILMYEGTTSKLALIDINQREMSLKNDPILMLTTDFERVRFVLFYIEEGATFADALTKFILSKGQ